MGGHLSSEWVGTYLTVYKYTRPHGIFDLAAGVSLFYYLSQFSSVLNIYFVRLVEQNKVCVINSYFYFIFGIT